MSNLPQIPIPDDTALPLKGLRVGISGAVPEREYWGDVRDLERLILSFVYQLSALVIRYGGTVVHGCQPLFTPVVAEAARQSAANCSDPLTLIASQLWGELPSVAARARSVSEKARVILTPKVGEGDVKDRDTRNQSLTALRLQLAKEADVLVAVGGKFHRDTGFNPGVLEELTVAKWHGVPCFVVAGLGGVAGKLEQALLQEFCANNLLPRSEPGSSLDVVTMATWSERIDEYVGKLLAHFARNCETFKRRRLALYRQDIRPMQVISGVPSQVATINIEQIRWCTDEFDRLKHALDKADIGAVQNVLRGSRYKEEKPDKPAVIYRETIRKQALALGEYRSQSRGRREYGECWIRLIPMLPGLSSEFDIAVAAAEHIPGNFIPAIQRGILKAAEHGSLAGYPVVDFRVVLSDGSYHEVDSNDHAFEMAANIAFKNALEQAKPVLLEPHMNVEITIPEVFTATVLGDLNSRRGRIERIDTHAIGATVNAVVGAQVPLAEMLTYAEHLSSMTKGQGSYSMDMSHYEVVPEEIQKKIVAESKGKASKLQFADEASSEA